MKWTLGFLTIVVAVAVSGQGVSSPPFPPTSEPTSTTPPVTTTSEPTTTATEPTTTATEVITTSDTPPTTTEQTTTTEIATTTAVVTTTNEPAKDEWVLTDENGDPCLKVKAHMTFKIKEFDNKEVVVPKDAAATGQCDYVSEQAQPESNRQHLHLNFSIDSQVYSVDMIFQSGPESEKSDKMVVKVTEWALNYVNKTGDDTTSSVTEPMLQFNANSTYGCNYGRKFKMTSDNSLEAKDLLFSPFIIKDVKLGEETCEEDKTNDIVPIAVGCALAALVIIVLIAYLIGRRRSRQKGYQSV